MSDEINFDELTPEEQKAELESLKSRADQLGISYHPSIGLQKLAEKVREHFAALEAEEEEDAVEAAAQEEAVAPVREETDKERAIRKKKEAGKLVRIRITCMNPNKSEIEGEIFTAGNALVGTYKKFVPYNAIWHVPQIILNMIEARQCQVFTTVTDPRTRQKARKGKLVKEFAVERLPDLSEKELSELAQRQAMANGTANAA